MGSGNSCKLECPYNRQIFPSDQCKDYYRKLDFVVINPMCIDIFKMLFMFFLGNPNPVNCDYLLLSRLLLIYLNFYVEELVLGWWLICCSGNRYMIAASLVLLTPFLDMLQIYLLDIHVFYTVISAIWGFLLGARDRLGEVSNYIWFCFYQSSLRWILFVIGFRFFVFAIWLFNVTCSFYFQIRSLEALHKLFEQFPGAFIDTLHISIPNRWFFLNLFGTFC